MCVCVDRYLSFRREVIATKKVSSSGAVAAAQIIHEIDATAINLPQISQKITIKKVAPTTECKCFQHVPSDRVYVGQHVGFGCQTGYQ